jgi:hypothetical protein
MLVAYAAYFAYLLVKSCSNKNSPTALQRLGSFSFTPFVGSFLKKRGGKHPPGGLTTEGALW